MAMYAPYTFLVDPRSNDPNVSQCLARYASPSWGQALAQSTSPVAAGADAGGQQQPCDLVERRTR